MIDTLEQDLHDLFAQDADSYDVSLALMRLEALGGRRLPRSRAMWPSLGGATAVLAGAIVTAVLLFTTAGPAAYPAWAAVPTAAASSAVSVAGSDCANGFTGRGTAVYKAAFSQQPVLAETRGDYTALVSTADGNLYSCLTISGSRNESKPAHIRISDYGQVLRSPPAGRITAPYQLQGGVGGGDGVLGANLRAAKPSLSALRPYSARIRFGGYGPTAVGQAGPGVAAVTFTFASGQTVSATVQGGWYFAWWPWLRDPASATISTDSGTATSALKSYNLFRDSMVPQCRGGSAGCVFTSAGEPAAPTN